MRPGLRISSGTLASFSTHENLYTVKRWPMKQLIKLTVDLALLQHLHDKRGLHNNSGSVFTSFWLW